MSFLSLGASKLDFEKSLVTSKEIDSVELNSILTLHRRVYQFFQNCLKILNRRERAYYSDYKIWPLFITATKTGLSQAITKISLLNLIKSQLKIILLCSTTTFLKPAKAEFCAHCERPISVIRLKSYFKQKCNSEKNGTLYCIGLLKRARESNAFVLSKVVFCYFI